METNNITPQAIHSVAVSCLIDRIPFFRVFQRAITQTREIPSTDSYPTAPLIRFYNETCVKMVSEIRNAIRKQDFLYINCTAKSY